MMVHGKAELHQFALTALAGPAGEALGTDALAGVAALTGRAVHLARRERPLLGHTSEPPGAERTFDYVIACLKGQDPAAATDAAAAVFATFVGLLVDFIGEPLTAGLLRKAWPHAVASASK